MQRIFDILVSGVALLTLLPLTLPLMVILRCTGEGEVFFKQLRIGYKGNNIEIYKFATMLKDSPNIGAGTLTMKNDSRVLPIGKFLRKTKINEIPQLLNIFLGDMSLVGPRPLVPDGEINYTADQSKIIRSVKPGVTGIGSLVLRDEEGYYAHRSDAKEFYRNVISPYKASLEIWYVENKSFMLNIKIILATIIAIVNSSWNALDFFRTAPKIPDKMVESKLIQ